MGIYEKLSHCALRSVIASSVSLGLFNCYDTADF